MPGDVKSKSYPTSGDCGWNPDLQALQVNQLQGKRMLVKGSLDPATKPSAVGLHDGMCGVTAFLAEFGGR